MAITIEGRITQELARLRMWRDIATADEIAVECAKVHDRINNLLDIWEAHSHAHAASS